VILLKPNKQTELQTRLWGEWAIHALRFVRGRIRALLQRPKKKLPRPRRGRAGRWFLGSFRKRLNFGLEAKLSELSHQALGFLFNWAAIEIATPEISMFDAVL
jgi:hypothetical protein